ncbi:PREDICTED: modification methylase DpnIIA-like [Cyphomyrmex costatus]|uniref:modification methylase DpnIIA-like n=1 Tax=Cyphomyrmex costatus TaxID=456900 RepID=UPI0008523975|nr:PREDICTED: modification methylase DpnIIA-like [Cyphomyrmex costatus]
MTNLETDQNPADDGWACWATLARPLFKWAGGKQRFLWEHRERIPEGFNTYHEPFGGGLSVFFHVAARSSSPVKAVLADVNLRVIRTYEEVKWEPDVVSDRLRQLEAGYNVATDKVAFYLDVRAQHNRTYPRPDAARFIFLMKVAWNGVFRINQAGSFNVPHGNLKAALRLPSLEEVTGVSVALSQSRLRAQSWETGLNDMQPGDFAFFDPPYFHDDNRRDLYERNRVFTFSDQIRLADALVDLKQRGVDFLLTNSARPQMIQLYRDRGLRVEEIEVHRSISSKTQGRGREGELVVTPGTQSDSPQLIKARLRLMMKDI